MDRVINYQKDCWGSHQFFGYQGTKQITEGYDTVQELVEHYPAFDSAVIIRNTPKAGEVWQHFKGDRYLIETVARHTETNEQLVIYRCIKTDDADKRNQIYARPLAMFMSLVDREKYPEVLQEFRFEKQ